MFIASFLFEFLLIKPYGPIHFNFKFFLVPRLAFNLGQNREDN